MHIGSVRNRHSIIEFPFRAMKMLFEVAVRGRA
jgi:hypothetical protein